MNPIRLGIFGAAGRLGQLIVARAVDDGRFALVSAVVRANSTHLGAAVNGDSSVRYGTALRGDETVIVDVSGATGADVLVAQMRTTQAALICASTGHSLAQRHDIQALAQTRAVLISANLSVGVAVLAEVLREVTQRLPGWDVEIVETRRTVRNGTVARRRNRFRPRRSASDHWSKWIAAARKRRTRHPRGSWGRCHWRSHDSLLWRRGTAGVDPSRHLTGAVCERCTDCRSVDRRSADRSQNDAGRDFCNRRLTHHKKKSPREAGFSLVTRTD
jgi:hypothetical protein